MSTSASGPVTLSNDGEDIMQLTVGASPRDAIAGSDLEDRYEISRCADQIKAGGYRRVALQFPDSMLPDASAVVEALTLACGSSSSGVSGGGLGGGSVGSGDGVDSSDGNSGQDSAVAASAAGVDVASIGAAATTTIASTRFVILADTSYGSCCVDEVAAEHAAADLIIHYGASCLSRTSRTPVLLVFGCAPLNVEDCAAACAEQREDIGRPLLVVTRTEYAHLVKALDTAFASVPHVIAGIDNKIEPLMPLVATTEENATTSPMASPASAPVTASATPVCGLNTCGKGPDGRSGGIDECCGGGCGGGKSIAVAATAPEVLLSSSSSSSKDGSCEACTTARRCHSSSPVPLDGTTSTTTTATTSNTSNSKGYSSSAPASTDDGIARFGRHFVLLPETSLADYDVLYIGGASDHLYRNLIMAYSSCPFYLYEPSIISSSGLSSSSTSSTSSSSSSSSSSDPPVPPGRLRREVLDVSRMLMKRYFMIQKARDADTVGIVAGTLGVSQYRKALNQLRAVAALAGKKTYTFVMGKLNVAKMANFTEVDVFVLVACPESTLIDSSEFYRPVVTPYEFEMACNPAREWTGKYLVDFHDVLPALAVDMEQLAVEAPAEDAEPAFSLITGSYKTPRVPLGGGGGGGGGGGITSTALEVRNMDSNLATGEHFASRTFRGLEQRLGETPVVDTVEGTVGRAWGYAKEPEAAKEV